MRFNLLGPMEVHRSGGALDLGGTRQRALLAALLARANQASTVPYLLDSVWATPPAAPASNIRTYVASLRRKLAALGEADRIATYHGGYVLRVLPGELDLLTFARRLDEGEAAMRTGDVATAADMYAGALSLWRGKPFEGLDIGPGLESEAVRLEERRLYAADRFARAAERIHRYDDVVRTFNHLVTEYPLTEELWAGLIEALHNSGRRSAALDTYHRAAKHLSDELGLAPGVQLRQLHRRLLAGTN